MFTPFVAKAKVVIYAFLCCFDLIVDIIAFLMIAYKVYCLPEFISQKLLNFLLQHFPLLVIAAIPI